MRGGADEVLEEVAEQPGAAVRGRYFNQPKIHFVLGFDLVGIVEGVDEGLIGQRVAALTETGAWADRVALDAAVLAPVPEGLGPAEAVAAVTWSRRCRPGSSGLGRGGAMACRYSSRPEPLSLAGLRTGRCRRGP